MVLLVREAFQQLFNNTSAWAFLNSRTWGADTSVIVGNLPGFIVEGLYGAHTGRRSVVGPPAAMAGACVETREELGDGKVISVLTFMQL